MTDYKASVNKSLEKYLKKQLKKDAGPQRKNKAPEKDFVKYELLPWLEKNGFDYNVVEAKAVYNPKLGRYLKGQTDKGFCDVVGNDSDGVAVFIEAKAPGKRRVIMDTKHEHQRGFLVRKISMGCFAGCFDSVKDLELCYRAFKRGASKQWMLKHLMR